MYGKRSSKLSKAEGCTNNSLVVGIDLGGTHFQVGVVDGSGNIRGRARGLTGADDGGGDAGDDGEESGGKDGGGRVVKRLADGVREACRDAKVSLGDDIRGIGIGTPSPIDSNYEVALEAVNLGWQDYPLAANMQEELGRNGDDGIPVTLDNDVNCAVWGEFILGAGRGYSSLLGLWIGTGIGGGLVFNGQLFHGARGTAGEIGRAVLYPDRQIDSWVYEDWASRKSMERRIREAVKRGEESVLAGKVMGEGGGAISSSDMAHAVDLHDDTACQIVRDSARMTGIMAANACTLLSLDAIVIGGGIAEEMGEVFVRWMREAFAEAVFPAALQNCAIKVTELRENAGLLGAALLARKRFESK